MDKAKFYAALRKDRRVFGTSLSKRQVEGIEGLLKAFETHGDGKSDTLAYGLATAYHETARRMVPVRETLAISDDQAIRRLDAWARKKGRTSNIYWRRQGRYNQAYFGRGHPQLTWERNYLRASKDAGVDLLRYPGKMLDPVISARVLWRGLLDGRWNGKGHGLRHYLDRGDLKNARRTVNITDRWQDIKTYHEAFLAAIDAAGGVPVRKAPPSRPTARYGGLWSRIRSAFRGK
jgi:hypothetical protein